MAKETFDTHRIVPSEGGGWDIIRDGGKKASFHFDTKKEAEAKGRELAKSQNTVLATHGKEGKLQTETNIKAKETQKPAAAAPKAEKKDDKKPAAKPAEKKSAAKADAQKTTKKPVKKK